MHNRHSRLLLLFLMVVLVLRLAYGLAQDTQTPYTQRAGDSWWYLETGLRLIQGGDVSQITTPPVYLVLLGAAQAVFSEAEAIIAVRVLQAILSTATVYGAFVLASRLATPRAGLIAAAVLAVAPAFVLEAGQIGTETVYIFLVTAALAAFVRWAAQGPERPRWLGPLALAAVLLGLATLTRAVLILFPLGLAAYLFFVLPWRKALARALWLIAVYAAVVSTWTIYNLARWDRFVVGGDGFAAFLYLGATGWDGPDAVDERLEAQTDGPLSDVATAPERQEAYVDAARGAILDDIPGYLRRRVAELGGAYLQPHGVTLFPGESLRELALVWLRDDRTPAGLLRLTQGEAFWPKLVIYLFHYAALLVGLAGLWLTRRRWRLALPLIGFILYTSLIHLVLLALPRYIFPTEVFWWVFAAAAIAHWSAPAESGEPR